MADLKTPSPSQLEQARAALLPLVAPYRFDGEAPPLWRVAHQALCCIEQALGVPPTVPTRETRRKPTP